MVFYGYLQIRHYAQTITPNLQFSTPSLFEHIILVGGSAHRGLIFNIYRIFNAYSIPAQGKHAYMLHWERVLGEEIPIKTWQAIWSQAGKSSICTLYKENAYKCLKFWYPTLDVLHVIYPSIWSCHVDKGTLFHTCWSGPLIAPFWHSTQQLLTCLSL